jgi:hypothetical protein
MEYTIAYSLRKLDKEVNHICTCPKIKGIVDGGYCYAKDRQGNIIKLCESGYSLEVLKTNDIINLREIR